VPFRLAVEVKSRCLPLASRSRSAWDVRAAAMKSGMQGGPIGVLPPTTGIGGTDADPKRPRAVSDLDSARSCDIASKGSFMLDCEHGGRHCASPSDLKAAQWKFFKDHPFGVDPEPYRPTPPAGVPSFCAVCE
jgi:hypothetical protein